MIDADPGLPHVTEILARAGLIDATWFTDYARERGQRVHTATQFLDEGLDVDWQSLPPDVVPRVRQYQIFREAVRPDILDIEEKVENLTLRYQGKPDRRVRIGGREGILDIKPPSRCAWHRLQLSLYAACFKQPMARWNLYLSDERYQLVEHKDRSDWDVAKACITLAAWKERHGNGTH